MTAAGGDAKEHRFQGEDDSEGPILRGCEGNGAGGCAVPGPEEDGYRECHHPSRPDSGQAAAYQPLHRQAHSADAERDGEAAHHGAAHGRATPCALSPRLRYIGRRCATRPAVGTSRPSGACATLHLCRASRHAALPRAVECTFRSSFEC